MKYLLNVLKEFNDENSDIYQDIHICIKALGILHENHCETWNQSKVLYFSGVINIVKQIMECAFMAPTREASIFCRKLMANPDGMLLWCKFGGPCITSNSALTNDTVVMWGEPHRLPKH